MGFCINYVYFISSQIGSIFNCTRPGALESTCALDDVVKENVNLWYFLPVLMVIYVPLVWIRNLEKLAFTHLIGDVIIIVVVTSCIVYAGIEISDQGGALVNPLVTPVFFKAVPYSAFAFEGVAVVLPLRDVVEDK